ncbi:hypothetical protein FA15DRAFT_592782 [Coprinopsis marcescibilis]|uniref:DUF6697 domain-containing protein n=1 Tax=Coprinopsis marcescibilis TaxID=230819 RepID=A0A5C3KUQ3_COPMA|nr:hypothetical protein FA15DRAFT_592782 [Coprinopsis marcescibilis]
MEPFKVSIEDEVRDVAVSRDKFISRIYGGSPIRVFPTISQKMLKKHGLNDFMFLCGDIQSRAPEMPGHVGLWYSCGYDYFDAPMRVITRVQDKPARWQYQGQYHVEYSKPLTREEWSMQPVRNAWSQALYEERWGCEIRGIVYAYKMYGREPTEKEVDLICAQGLCKKATPEDISLGMARGDVTISVFIMKCVGYDEKFQRELAERWDGGQGIFKPTGSSTRKKGTKRTRSSEKAPIQRKKGRFAADLRHETEEESDLPTSDEDEEDDEGGDDNGLYSTRGTRSNPIALG